MFTYQHRTKQSSDHIGRCFSLSRDHNKLCIGQCSRLSEFGVVKVRPRARLLSTQDRSVPLEQPHHTRVWHSLSCLWTRAQQRGRHLLLGSQVLQRHNRHTFLSRNTEKTLPNQNSFWESPSSEGWANWKEYIWCFDINTILSLCPASFPFRMADAGWLKELLNKVKMLSKLH